MVGGPAPNLDRLPPLPSSAIFRALDLSPLGYDRVRENRPMVETVVY